MTFAIALLFYRENNAYQNHKQIEPPTMRKAVEEGANWWVVFNCIDLDHSNSIQCSFVCPIITHTDKLFVFVLSNSNTNTLWVASSSFVYSNIAHHQMSSSSSSLLSTPCDVIAAPLFRSEPSHLNEPRLFYPKLSYFKRQATTNWTGTKTRFHIAHNGNQWSQVEVSWKKFLCLLASTYSTTTTLTSRHVLTSRYVSLLLTLYPSVFVATFAFVQFDLLLNYWLIYFTLFTWRRHKFAWCNFVH